jgi:hypothetical protein
MLAALSGVSCGGNASIASAAPHLFIDSAEIAQQLGVDRVVERPVRYGRPIIGPDQRNFTPYVSVLKMRRGFRLYYNSADAKGYRQISYVDSPDGLGVHGGGSQLALPPVDFGVSIIPQGAGYRLAWFDRGLRFAGSPDGIHWSQLPAGPSEQEGVSDIVSITRFAGRYVAMFKMLEGGYAIGSRTAGRPGVRRVVGVSTSADGVRWSRPRIVIRPDARDSGVTEFYSVGGMIQRGGLLIGMLKVLRDDVDDGVGHTVLAWSRDGESWHRDTSVFLDRSPSPGWDHAMAWGDSQLRVGTRTRIYYGGYSGGHKSNPATERRIGVASIPVDRYVARVARAHGELLTTPVRLGARMRLNARVRGALTIRVSARGHVTQTCRIPSGDYLYRPVCGQLPRSPVRVRFDMRDVSLYAIS